MESNSPIVPLTITAGDIRGLLACLNALRAASAAGRAAVLAERLLWIGPADAAAVDVLGPDLPPVRVAVSGDPPDELAERLLGVPDAVTDAAESVVTIGPDAPPDAGRHDARPAAGSGAVSADSGTSATSHWMRSVYAVGGITSAVTLWRRQPFDTRAVTLLRVLHPEVAWALVPAPPVPPVPKGMTGTVLELMLNGLAEKEIARRLNRSAHTVHAHVKRVYRHYNVRSRPELLATHFGKRTGDE